MDINEKITRNKKVEHKPEPKNEAPHVFDLHCSVELLDQDTDGSENYKVTGKVHAEQMDADLMSTILAKIIKTSVPNNSIKDVDTTTYFDSSTQNTKTENQNHPS